MNEPENKSSDITPSAQLTEDRMKITELEGRIESLEKNIETIGKLLTAAFNLSIAGAAGSYKSLAEMRSLIKTADGDTKPFDVLMDGISSSINEIISIKQGKLK